MIAAVVAEQVSPSRSSRRGNRRSRAGYQPDPEVEIVQLVHHAQRASPQQLRAILADIVAPLASRLDWNAHKPVIICLAATSAENITDDEIRDVRDYMRTNGVNVAEPLLAAFDLDIARPGRFGAHIDLLRRYINDGLETIIPVIRSGLRA